MLRCQSVALGGESDGREGGAAGPPQAGWPLATHPASGLLAWPAGGGRVLLLRVAGGMPEAADLEEEPVQVTTTTITGEGDGNSNGSGGHGGGAHLALHPGCLPPNGEVVALAFSPGTFLVSRAAVSGGAAAGSAAGAAVDMEAAVGSGGVATASAAAAAGFGVIPVPSLLLAIVTAGRGAEDPEEERAPPQHRPGAVHIAAIPLLAGPRAADSGNSGSGNGSGDSGGNDGSGSGSGGGAGRLLGVTPLPAGRPFASIAWRPAATQGHGNAGIGGIDDGGGGGGGSVSIGGRGSTRLWQPRPMAGRGGEAEDGDGADGDDEGSRAEFLALASPGGGLLLLEVRGRDGRSWGVPLVADEWSPPGMQRQQRGVHATRVSIAWSGRHRLVAAWGASGGVHVLRVSPCGRVTAARELLLGGGASAASLRCLAAGPLGSGCLVATLDAPVLLGGALITTTTTVTTSSDGGRAAGEDVSMDGGEEEAEQRQWLQRQQGGVELGGDGEKFHQQEQGGDAVDEVVDLMGHLGRAGGGGAARIPQQFLLRMTGKETHGPAATPALAAGGSRGMAAAAPTAAAAVARVAVFRLADDDDAPCRHDATTTATAPAASGSSPAGPGGAPVPAAYASWHSLPLGDGRRPDLLHVASDIILVGSTTSAALGSSAGEGGGGGTGPSVYAFRVTPGGTLCTLGPMHVPVAATGGGRSGGVRMDSLVLLPPSALFAVLTSAPAPRAPFLAAPLRPSSGDGGGWGDGGRPAAWLCSFRAPAWPARETDPRVDAAYHADDSAVGVRGPGGSGGAAAAGMQDGRRLEGRLERLEGAVAAQGRQLGELRSMMAQLLDRLPRV